MPGAGSAREPFCGGFDAADLLFLTPQSHGTKCNANIGLFTEVSEV